ncbi:MAG: acyltransferase [Coxiella endosymbiont of Haemaphysalis qinghaiensis]
MRRFFNSLLGVFLIFLYIITSLILGVLALIFGLLARLMPLKSWYQAVMKTALLFPILWATTSGKFLSLRHHRWKIEGKGNLSPDQWYLLISNHQTWLDILVLGRVFGRKIPVIKFFMKRELLWSLPILGLSCWSLGYPFLHRHSRHKIRKQPELKGQDIETTKKACEKFREFPTTVMNFVEGTRFTTAKQQHQSSPYLHLLKPKSGGIAIVMKELRNELNGILNVTIHYSRPIILWKYFCGDHSTITVHYELLSLTDDLIGDYYENRYFRRYFQKWLNSVWKCKDLLLDELSCTNDDSQQK